ncbi:MAG: GNAT family N-acetyltransferase [Actinobacteria bacterium]|nr:MAG: GNAT family N-acetyltransferase [Actinomycetota bacterium]
MAATRALAWLGWPGPDPPVVSVDAHLSERVSLNAYRSAYPEGVFELDGATALRVPPAPSTPMLNRIVGLGLEAPATEEQLDAAIAVMEGLRHYVSVSPHARPPELPGWLRARGFEPGWGWMQFRRGVDDPPAAATSLSVVEIDPQPSRAFGRIVREAYGLPEAMESIVASAPVRRGWRCWLALSEGEPAAAAGLYVDGEAGYLGYASTAPEHRGKGAQSTLLATRIRRARELGCNVLFTEAGKLLPNRPSVSYRNIARAGFEELYVVPNWLSPA